MYYRCHCLCLRVHGATTPPHTHTGRGSMVQENKWSGLLCRWLSTLHPLDERDPCSTHTQRNKVGPALGAVICYGAARSDLL